MADRRLLAVIADLKHLLDSLRKLDTELASYEGRFASLERRVLRLTRPGDRAAKRRRKR